MSGYEGFSQYYDRLMQEVDYPARAADLADLFATFDRMPTLLLDLACGTGGFSLEFAKRGVEVIGVDPSAEMLCVAREKAEAAGQQILFLCQPGQELELYGTVDGAICCLDSLNHITDPADFDETLRRVSLFLEPGRLFLFDVNTVYKHRAVLADRTFVLEADPVFCVWQNHFDPATLTTDVTLDFFERTGETYRRTTEWIEERAYAPRRIVQALRRAGLKLEAIYGDGTRTPPGRDCERAVYVTRKEF